MSNFLANIIHRHVPAENTVRPRLRGLYEPRSSVSENLPAFQHFKSGENTLHPEYSDTNRGEKGRNEPVREEKRYKPSLDQPMGKSKISTPIDTVAPEAKKELPGKIVEPVRPIIPKAHEKSPSISPSPIPKIKEAGPRREHHKLTGSKKKAEEIKESVLLPITEKKAAVEYKTVSEIREEKRVIEELQKKVTRFVPEIPKPDPAKRKPEKSATPNSDTPLSPTQPDLSLHHSALWNIRNPKNEMTSQSSPPSIKIHIGRIEIKAVKPPPVKKGKAQEPLKPRISLEQFLKKREGKL